MILKKILDKQKLKRIEEAIVQMHVPSDIGRIPNKISSCFSSLTGAEWKNFTLIFEPALYVSFFN